MNRSLEADIQRMTDQRVADGHFIEIGKLAKQRQITKVEVVAGIDAEAERMCQLGSRGVCSETGIATASAEVAGERFSVELDRSPPISAAQRTASATGSTNRLTRTPSFFIPATIVRNSAARRRGRPTGLARDFARLDRHQRALRRTDLHDQFKQVGPRVSFDIEFDVRRAFQQLRDLMYIGLS